MATASFTPTSASATISSRIPLNLQVIGGEYDGRTIGLTAQKIMIGSSPRATLRLVGCGASAVELFIIRGNEGTVVRNASPRNLLNGAAFSDASLETGDHLAVGAFQFRVLPFGKIDQEDTPSVPKARAKQDYPATQLLDDESAGLARELAEAQSAANALREELRTHEADARADLEQWRQEREQWIDELATARQETLDARQQLSERESAWTGQADELRREVEEWKSLAETEASQAGEQSLVAELEGQLEQMRLEAEEWKALAESESSSLAAAPESNGSLESEIKDLRREVEEWKALAECESSSSSESKEQQDKILELEMQLEQVSQDRDRVAGELAEAVSRASELEKKCEAFHAATDAAATAISEAQSRIEELESELAKEKNSADETSEEGKPSDQDRQRFEDRVAELELRERELNEREKQLDQEQEELEARRQEVEIERSADAPGDSSTVANATEEQERALAEMLRLRQELDQQSEDLSRREAALSSREQQVGANPGGANWEADDFDSNTIMLDDQEPSAMTVAQRFLREPEEPFGDSTEEDEKTEELLLNDEGPEETKQNTPVSSSDKFFSTPDPAAPVDAAAILAKYSDYEAEEDPASNIAETTFQEEVQPPESTSDSGASASDGFEPDDDDSIRDYMDQLMRRVCGDSPRMPDSTPTVAEPKKPEPEEILVEEKPKAINNDSFELMNSAEFMPRSAAPEQSDRLAKMREVANASASSAINTATKRRRAQTAVVHVVMAAGAIAVGATLVSYQSAGIPLVRYVTAAAAWGIAAWWGYRGISYGLGRHQLPAKSLVSTFTSKFKRNSGVVSPEDLQASDD